jgi:hypothetical protein
VAINIKNQRAVVAVKNLAAHYGGVSYSAAIAEAAATILSQPAPREADLAAADALRIAAEYRQHCPDGAALDQSVLYDADGLYK